MTDETSAAFAAAASWRREVRAEFEAVREAAYEMAETETNGRMLNRRGLDAGVDPWSLFTHNRAYAHAYASEELLDHWQTYRRPTFLDYEAQTFPGLAS